MLTIYLFIHLFRIWYAFVIVASFVGNFADNQVRVDHMQQLPEELRRLQRLAGPLSSHREDEVPCSWQTCPTTKRLRREGRRNIPSFSDTTVQYVIDCNNMVCSADKDFADELLDVNTSGTVSPPRKQPRLDEVDFSRTDIAKKGKRIALL